MSAKELSDFAVLLGFMVCCAFVVSVVGALIRIFWISICEDD